MGGRLFTFTGCADATYWVRDQCSVTGPPLPTSAAVSVYQGEPSRKNPSATWTLRGITSNERYIGRDAKQSLVAVQKDLGRPEASLAALILIRKSDAWWALPQDERREILAVRSKHIEVGTRYAERIARRLHHCRDLSEHELFDFITWFEYGHQDSSLFGDLVGTLRSSEEWNYVEHEVQILLTTAR